MATTALVKAASHVDPQIFPLDELPQEVIDLIGSHLSASDPLTLLQWSSTCRFYRSLFAPLVFNSVTIGIHINTLPCVQTLHNNQHVRSLTVSCATDRLELRRSRMCADLSTYGSGQKNNHTWINCSYIETILSQLPPSLESLTLYFPDDWLTVNQVYWPCFSFEPEQSPLTHHERINLHRRLLWTIFDSVAKNHLMGPKDNGFSLTIHNMAPHPSGVYHQPCLRAFLKRVTSFTMSLCKFQSVAGDRVRLPKIGWFRYMITGWFYDVLRSVTELKLVANAAWQVAMRFNGVPCYSTLSPLPTHFTQLRHLALENMFIDSKLVDYLTFSFHASILESVTLHNCFCHTITNVESEAETLDFPDAPTWSDLFRRLAKATTRKLTSVKVTYDISLISERMPCYFDKRHRHNPELCVFRKDSLNMSWVCESLIDAAAVDSQCDEYTRFSDAACRRHLHRSMVFLYTTIDPVKRTFTSGVWDTTLRYADGTDLDSWKRLVDKMTRNGGRNLPRC
ncbi:hypothetical protein PV08_01685 [Exophiala spinifera]|uniref:F-box domain-containing protein n=1 Tax=Exophiala spinifera TaxID=91928 RepID=A0A0D1Z0H9_9EURO|nr:uncharacterized protein PV08_01685 [Exophiala spinifera]KIW21106.1 hypothetical protein PV08_01685 [Exophiala spinifera]